MPAGPTFWVQVYERRDGVLVRGELLPALDAEAAAMVARLTVGVEAGAIALCQTRNPVTNEVMEVTILEKVGEALPLDIDDWPD